MNELKSPDLQMFCKMSVFEIRQYMKQFLPSVGLSPIEGKDRSWLYAKGEVPVLLVAHMDTIHKQKCTRIITTAEGNITSPQGIGGDDRCGIYIVSKILEVLKCSVLFTDEEEIGGKGAEAFCESAYINKLDVNYMIEFDRKGNNDAVFYSCNNTDFTNFVLDATGYKKEYGTFTDISLLMPTAKIAGVNLSCGYYKPHTKDEYIVPDEVDATIQSAIALIKTECEKPFVFVASKTYGGCSSYGRSHSWSSVYDDYDEYYGYLSKTKKKSDPLLTDTLTLTVIYQVDATVPMAYAWNEDTTETSEQVAYAEGKTKWECWARLFLENPTLKREDIVEVSWD